MGEIEHIKIGPTLKGTSGSWHRKGCPFFEFDGRTDPIAMGHCTCTDTRTTQRRDGKEERWRIGPWKLYSTEEVHGRFDRRRIRDRRKGQDDG